MCSCVCACVYVGYSGAIKAIVTSYSIVLKNCSVSQVEAQNCIHIIYHKGTGHKIQPQLVIYHKGTGHPQLVIYHKGTGHKISLN